jgi:glycine cleavage system protein P-like pyridoxal-binding family
MKMILTSEYLAAELAEAYEVLAYTGNDRIDFQFVLDRLARLITELGGEVPTE